MKTTKSFITTIVCAMAVVFSFSSCLDSDNENNISSRLTVADSIQAMSNIAGTYSGRLYYIDPNAGSSNNEKYSNINWGVTINEGTTGILTVTNFPVSPLALYISNTSTNTLAKQILEAAPTQTYTAIVKPYIKLNTTTSTYYQYTILPRSKQLSFSVEYNNREYDVKITFADYIQDAAGYYYYPIAYKSGNTFQGNIVIDNVSVDNVEYKVSTVFGMNNSTTTSN